MPAITILSTPKADTGMQMPGTVPLNILNGGYLKPVSGDTFLSVGKSHANGGMDADSTGDGKPDVNIEGGETIHQSPFTGDTIVGGNLYIPGTKTKFKKAFKEIGNHEAKVDKLALKGNKLLETKDPDNKYGVLAYNAGNVMAMSANRQKQALSAEKEHLTQLQDAIHQVANVAGVKPEEVTNKMKFGGIIPQFKNGGKIPQASDGKTVGKWRYNNTNLEGEDPKILEFVKLLEKKGYSGQSGPKSGVSNRYTKSGNPSRHIKGQALDMFFDNGKDAYQSILNDPELAGYLAANGLTALNEYDPNVAKGTGATAGHIHIGYDRGTKLADTFRRDAMAKYPNWDWQGGLKASVPNNIKSVPRAQLNQARKVVGDAQEIPVAQQEIAPGFRFDLNPKPTIQPEPTAPQITSFNPYDFSAGVQNTVSQKKKIPSLADSNKLGIGRFLPELAALADKPVPVAHERLTPELFTPYNVSFQDRLNANNSSFNTANENLVNNPEAAAVLLGQKYNADNQVAAEQFRTNQGIENDITNKNINLINQTREKNLQLKDQQFVRQTQANENTLANKRAAINSIDNKFAQNKLENNTIRMQESLYNHFRWNPNTNKLEYQEGAPVVFSPVAPVQGPQYSPNTKDTYEIGPDGKPVLSKVVVDNTKNKANKRYWGGSTKKFGGKLSN